MKRVLLITIMCSISFVLNAQNRYRLNEDLPYDVMISLKGSYHTLQDNFKDNYDWGAGGSLSVQWYYEEQHFSWGIDIGYDRFQPKSIKLPFLPTKQLFVAWQMPITLFVNYYLNLYRHDDLSFRFFAGIGGSTVWGTYDYSFSTLDNDYTTGQYTNMQEYYFKDFEAQSGFKFGFIPRAGFFFTPNHKHAFGIEASMEKYFANGRLEKQLTYTGSIFFTYIID